MCVCVWFCVLSGAGIPGASIIMSQQRRPDIDEEDDEEDETQRDVPDEDEELAGDEEDAELDGTCSNPPQPCTA
jgi:hypothetical protein